MTGFVEDTVKAYLEKKLLNYDKEVIGLVGANLDVLTEKFDNIISPIVQTSLVVHFLENPPDNMDEKKLRDHLCHTKAEIGLKGLNLFLWKIIIAVEWKDDLNLAFIVSNFRNVHLTTFDMKKIDESPTRNINNLLGLSVLKGAKKGTNLNLLYVALEKFEEELNPLITVEEFFANFQEKGFDLNAAQAELDLIRYKTLAAGEKYIVTKFSEVAFFFVQEVSKMDPPGLTERTAILKLRGLIEPSPRPDKKLDLLLNYMKKGYLIRKKNETLSEPDKERIRNLNAYFDSLETTDDRANYDEKKMEQIRESISDLLIRQKTLVEDIAT